MRNLLKFLFILFLGVISCACVNIVAIHELNQKANDYLNAGDIQSAISRLEASVDLDGNIYESRYNLAAAYMKVNECEKALKHIEVALELAKNEPNVPYTHAVALQCVADTLFETKDQNGEVVPVKFENKEQEVQANEKYIQLLKSANLSFEKYLEMSVNANDKDQIEALINENNLKINDKKID